MILLQLNNLRIQLNLLGNMCNKLCSLSLTLNYHHQHLDRKRRTIANVMHNVLKQNWKQVTTQVCSIDKIVFYTQFSIKILSVVCIDYFSLFYIQEHQRKIMVQIAQKDFNVDHIPILFFVASLVTDTYNTLKGYNQHFL